MGDKNNLITYEPVNDFIVFKWGDGLESYIELKTLREKCPCANCEGETDIPNPGSAFASLKVLSRNRGIYQYCNSPEPK